MIKYKTFIEQVTSGGRYVGASVLVEDFETLEAAKRAGAHYRITPLSVVEVREYDLSKRAVIARGSEADTGKVVYRDTKNIIESLQKEFRKALHENDGFESTMSYLLDCIKDRSFPEWDYLHDAVELLTDDEVNDLLEKYGDRQYMVCVNGELQSVEHANEEIER